MRSTRRGTTKNSTRSVSWAEGTLAASTSAYTDSMDARMPSRSQRRPSPAVLTSESTSYKFILLASELPRLLDMYKRKKYDQNLAISFRNVNFFI